MYKRQLQTIPRTDPVELQSLIEEVLADLSSLAEKNGVQLMQKKRDDLIYTGSDILLYRMLFNLTENAIRYNHPGGCVTLSAEENADHNICITVADTGQGIPKEAQERIFQPFYRVDKSRSRAFGGVGLGLALVQKIAEPVSYTHLDVYKRQGQIHVLMERSFVPGHCTPQEEQICEEGKKRSIMTTCFPYHAALYFNCLRNSLQEASEMDLANFRFFFIFAGARSSIAIRS